MRLKIVAEQDVEEGFMNVDIGYDEKGCGASVCVEASGRPPTYARLVVDAEIDEVKEFPREGYEAIALEFLYLARTSYTTISAAVLLAYILDKLLKVVTGKMELEYGYKEWRGKFTK